MPPGMNARLSHGRCICRQHSRLSRKVPFTGGKLRQHLLLSYVKAFVAICDAQFTAKRLKR